MAETVAATAEQRFAATGDLMAQLFAEEKRQRILAISDQWPKLPVSSIAIIAEATPSYVSEVLKNQPLLALQLVVTGSYIEVNHAKVANESILFDISR